MLHLGHVGKRTACIRYHVTFYHHVHTHVTGAFPRALAREIPQSHTANSTLEFLMNWLLLHFYTWIASMRIPTMRTDPDTINEHWCDFVASTLSASSCKRNWIVTSLHVMYMWPLLSSEVASDGILRDKFGVAPADARLVTTWNNLSQTLIGKEDSDGQGEKDGCSNQRRRIMRERNGNGKKAQEEVSVWRLLWREKAGEEDVIAMEWE